MGNVRRYCSNKGYGVLKMPLFYKINKPRADKRYIPFIYHNDGLINTTFGAGDWANLLNFTGFPASGGRVLVIFSIRCMTIPIDNISFPVLYTRLKIGDTVIANTERSGGGETHQDANGSALNLRSQHTLFFNYSQVLSTGSYTFTIQAKIDQSAVIYHWSIQIIDFPETT